MAGDRRSAPSRAAPIYASLCRRRARKCSLSSSKLCSASPLASTPGAPATAAASIASSDTSIETGAMDDFSTISDHSMLLQGHGMFGAEGCLGTRSSSGVLPSLQDDRNNKGADMFFSDWPELVGFDDLEASLRNFDPTFEMGSNCFDDILWSSNCSSEAQLVRNGYSDDIDFSVDQSDSNSTLKVNTTKTKQQSRRNGTASNYDAHVASSSSGLSSVSDAQLFLPFDDTALASQTAGGWEGLEAILCTSPETRVAPAASSTMCTDGSSTCCCSGPDIVTAHHVPRDATKTKDSFNGAPDTILEEMAENPLDMYFPPLPASSEQTEMWASDTTSSAPKHRFPEEFAGSCALECAELQFCSEDMASAGLHGGQPAGSPAIVLDAVPVKDLSFQKLQFGMNQLDLATKGRIRDSLYRLANRLEQRHYVASTSGGLGPSGSNRFESDGWAGTQTNPTDRLVAQLLLQKPYSRKTAQPHRVT